MWGALDVMQGYNGRTRQGCILEAMGAEVKHGKSGGFAYRLETLKLIKEHTETMGL